MPFTKGHKINLGRKLGFIPKMAFKKGHIPWSKSQKGIHLSPNTEFKKGQTPWNKGLHMWKDRTHPKGMLGKISPNKGMRASQETIEKLRISHTGKKQSQETIMKRVIKNTGKKRSEEFCKNLRLRVLGNKYCLGHKRSKDEIEVIRQRRLKQVFPFKDTSIEVKLQNWLKEQGIEFQTHYPILGQPDIFIKPNVCIFVDGCYWHQCPQCGFKDIKILEKDQRVTKTLTEQGYTVIRIWEHDIKNNEFGRLNQFIS